MAQRTGLEPATLGVTGRYSNRLNYRCKVSLSKSLLCQSGRTSVKTVKLVGVDGLEPPTRAL